MSHELIRVGGPLHRVKLTMKPCQPMEGPITDGPLIRVGHPMQRVAVEMKPVSTPYLQLTFGVDPDFGLSPEAILAKVVPVLELVKGLGFTWDRTDANGVAGRIAIRLVPTTTEAAGKLSWLKDMLTPVFAELRDVSAPVMSEIPALKV